MPGPPLSEKFTYGGTPDYGPGKPSYVPPYMKQSNRFWKSKQIGTHKHRPKREHIQDNPSNRLGVGGGQIRPGE